MSPSFGCLLEHCLDISFAIEAQESFEQVRRSKESRRRRIGTVSLATH